MNDAQRVARWRAHTGDFALWRGLSSDAPRAPAGPPTALHRAVAFGGDLDDLSALVASGIDVNAPDPFGSTPVHLAASHHRPDAIDRLAALGADMNAADRVGFTALDHAHHDEATLAALFRHGACADGAAHHPWPGQPYYRLSAFTQAARVDRTTVLELFLNAGVGISHHPEALPEAALAGALNAVRWLLAHGADPRATTMLHHRPVGALEATACEAWIACARELLPVSRDDRSRALAVAVASAPSDAVDTEGLRTVRRRELVTFLLDEGASPDAALHASVQAHRWFAQTLLARGADPNRPNDAGLSPLHSAAMVGAYEVARLLLASGADAHARTPAGETAYDLAQRAYQQGNLDNARLVVNALADAGAGPPRPVDPPKAADPLGPGARVRHARFGEGTVQSSADTGDARKLTVAFDTAGSKTLLARFVSPIASP